MTRTIKAIERHMTRESASQPVRNRRREFVVEWRQRGPKTLSGRLNRKLRLVFAPAPSPALVTVGQ
jgi:hypothetical protein